MYSDDTVEGPRSTAVKLTVHHSSLTRMRQEACSSLKIGERGVRRKRVSVFVGQSRYTQHGLLTPLASRSRPFACALADIEGLAALLDDDPVTAPRFSAGTRTPPRATGPRRRGDPPAPDHRDATARAVAHASGTKACAQRSQNDRVRGHPPRAFREPP